MSKIASAGRYFSSEPKNIGYVVTHAEALHRGASLVLESHFRTHCGIVQKDLDKTKLFTTYCNLKLIRLLVSVLDLIAGLTFTVRT